MNCLFQMLRVIRECSMWDMQAVSVRGGHGALCIPVQAMPLTLPAAACKIGQVCEQRQQTGTSYSSVCNDIAIVLEKHQGSLQAK